MGRRRLPVLLRRAQLAKSLFPAFGRLLLVAWLGGTIRGHDHREPRSEQLWQTGGLRAPALSRASGWTATAINRLDRPTR